METHPTDPTALVAGLFFGLAGLAIFANQQWEDVDVTAFTAAGVMVIGLLLAGFVISRYLRPETEAPSTASDVYAHLDETQETPTTES